MSETPVAESPDLATALVDAAPAEREQLVRSADRAALESAVTRLGRRREPAAAEVLGLVDLIADDKALRKLARRELHRLRSTGIEAPPSTLSAPEAAAPRAPTVLPVSQAWATDIDPSGSRALWLLAERPLGGVWFSVLLLNELRGLPELNLLDTTRKRFQRELDESRKGPGTWVSLPGDYSLGLVREAIDVSREVGAGLPTRYPAFRDVFGEAAGPPARALAYETVSLVEVNFHPEWLDDSPRLLTEPELGGWFVPVGPELRQPALEAARATIATLLLPGRSPEQQATQLLADAAEQAVTPPVRRAMRRRLEETAYIFLATDRPGPARLAVSAAHALDNGNLTADRHPLLRLLLAAGLGRLVSGESIGGTRASEILLDLLERASERDSESRPSLETRPSGLILPR